MTQNQTIDFCYVPFYSKQCKIKVPDSHTICYVDPLDIHRQFKCTVDQSYTVSFIIPNFTICYPPYIDLFLNIMKTNRIVYVLFVFEPIDVFLELDLHSLINVMNPDIVTIEIWFTKKTTKFDLMVNSPMKNNLTVDDHWNCLFLQSDLTNTNYTMSKSTIKTDMLCSKFELIVKNNQTQIIEKYITCPSSKCLNHQNETRSCIGSIPCYHTGTTSLSCQIDRLRSNDQFNVNKSFLYSDLIIITTDNQKHTLHTFSKDLLNSCIAQRLVIIIIHGRLEIPLLSSTSFNCSYGLIVQLEFWHGNCSTFEMLYTADLERMYETNLITLGNFYTGQMDRLKIACTDHSSTPNTRARIKLSTFSWIILGMISIIIPLICVIILFHYKKTYRQYCAQLWRNLMMEKKINTGINPKATDNLNDASTTYDSNDLSVTLDNTKQQ